METTNCKNCNHPTGDDFCSKCGHPVKLNRINKDFVIHEIKDTLFTDKGFFYTTKRMLLRPGDSVRHYITEDRSRYVKPVTYIIITSLIYTLTVHLFKINYLEQFGTTDFYTMNQIKRWLVENRGYASIILDLYMAFWINRFFRKSNYNLFEIFILMCYLSGIKALFLSVTIILQAVIHSDMVAISIFIPMIYSFWAIGQFFDGKKAKSYLNAIFSYIVGIFSIVLIMSVAASIEFIIRY